VSGEYGLCPARLTAWIENWYDECFENPVNFTEVDEGLMMNAPSGPPERYTITRYAINGELPESAGVHESVIEV
jgi:hypothetical protein